jgi:phenylacetate-CoA ligase
MTDWHAVQRTRLREELRWARRSPFGDARIPDADLDLVDPIDVLQQTEFCDKHSYIAASDRGDVTVPGVPIVREYWTSGSSGKGKERVALGPVEDRTFLFAHVMQMRQAGLRRGDRIALTWPSGPQAGGVVIREAAEMLGIIGIELGNLTTEETADFMLRNDVRSAVGSALYIRRLLEVGGPAFSDHMNSCLVAGEHYPVAWAQALAAAQITAIEWYGSTQTGAMGMSCQLGLVDEEGNRRALHIPPHLYVTEVLRPDGTHVAEGERGELVITGLGRLATPFIRYRSGDEVRWLGWAACECGRTWPSIEAGTIERLDDMIRVRGINVWPSAVESIVYRSQQVVDYRGELWVDEAGKEQAHIVLEVPTLGDADAAALAGGIADELRETVGVRIETSTTREPLQTAEFKQRRWTDRRFQ